MKRIISHIYTVAAAVALLLTASCDKTYVNEIEKAAPEIESFSPMSAPVGAEIIITGRNLEAVTKAFIGDKEMVIKEKVSNTRLSIIAGAEGRDGKIALVNTLGRGESASAFTYAYAEPSLKGALLQPTVDMGDRLLLSGNNLTAVSAVIFTAEGYTTQNEGTIVEQSTEELLVRVPYVEGDGVSIRLRYFDGTSTVTTPLDVAPSIEVKRYKPQFAAATFERTAVGKTVTLTGTYLDKVGRILVNGFEAMASKQPTTLTFTVPAGDFVDGETTTTLVAEYFDGHETYMLNEAFEVYVPFVKFWESINTWCQSRNAEELSAFFSPETGIAYANEKWKTVIDPLSYTKFPTLVCSAANTPRVTETEYNSVAPYFFFSTPSSGDPQLNAPANSNGQLKNFFISPTGTPSNDYRVPGGNNTQYGTPALSFRYLNEANNAEKTLIELVKAQSLEKLDENNFPIDVTAGTIAGVGMTSAKGSPNSTIWGVGLFDKKDKMNVAVDAVLLVVYHDYRGAFKEGSTTEVRVDNVKRLGLLHIKTVDYINDGATAGTKSRFTFNCYWQKYDYDYSKIVK